MIEQGGLNIDSTEAIEHAFRMYEEIRKRKTDYIRVAENTGFSLEQVQVIKNYIFNDVHVLRNGVDRFYPSYDMAESWRRLSSKRKEDIKPHDITMLHHELTEIVYKLMYPSCSHDYAHDFACKLFDYPREVKEYYIKTGQRKS